MSFLDDLLNFGAGALDSVGEHSDWLFGNNNQTSNPSATQQPEHPAVDNNGNAVTVPQGQVTQSDDKTVWYIGGGLAFLLVLVLIIVLMKGK